MSEIKNESSALRYMGSDGKAIEGDAAQEFLQNKLRKGTKGRYTQEQLTRLEQSGGHAVVNASDGAIPAGDYYDSQNPTKNKGDGGAAGESGGPASYSDDLEYASDWAKSKYTSGEWGGGELSTEELAEKYNLDTSEEARKRAEGRDDDHDIWGRNADGSRVFIGNTQGSLDSLKTNSDLIGGHTTQKHSEEDDHSGDALSSEGDVKGALLNQWKGGAGEVKEEVVEEEENKPIEHSPELKQAVERVRTYENDVMSGKMSNDIFGGEFKPMEGGGITINGSNDYSFDHNTGSTGIGTSGGNAMADNSSKATSSFLDSKKTDVKKSFNLKPKSYSYGVSD